VLDRARNGVFSLAAMPAYSSNHQQAGGRANFAEYFTADDEWIVFRRQLRGSIVFGTHNLVSDASFNEFHLILCRNVLIYFQRELQERVHQLFCESLVPLGYLGLGRSETVRFTACRDRYTTIDARERLFRKIR
jgi:chemotaxis protein methyltransferase CheR